MSQQHDRDKRGELFPERHPGVPERHGEAEDECHRDGERDQRHHAGEPGPEFAPGALDERPAAVEEDGRAEDRCDQVRAWKLGRCIPEHSGEHVAPEQCRDRECEREPELVAEHRDRVAGVSVVSVTILLMIVHDHSDASVPFSPVCPCISESMACAPSSRPGRTRRKTARPIGVRLPYTLSRASGIRLSAPRTPTPKVAPRNPANSRM